MDRYYVQRQSKEFELCKINIQNSDLLGCFLHYRRGSPHFLENNKDYNAKYTNDFSDQNYCFL